MRIIYRHFQTNHKMRQAYGIRDLMMLNLQSEDKLSDFLFEWQGMMSNLKDPDSVDRDAVEEMFLEQIKKCSFLREDIAYYRRCALGHEDRSYEFLLARAKGYLAEERERANRASDVKARTGNSFSNNHSNPAAPGPKGGGKGKSKDRKGKGKSKGKESGSDAAPAPTPSPSSKGGGKGKATSSSSKGGGKNTTPKSEQPCWKFAKGECSDPSVCGRKHRALTAEERQRMESYFSEKASRASSPAPEQSTRREVCPQWKKGKCSLGNSCKFAHPKRLRGVDKKKTE